MTEVAVAVPNPWKVLHRIARINIVLGLFIWSRGVFELIQIHADSWHHSRFFQMALAIDLSMGLLSLLSGALLLRRHPRALLVSAISSGAIYSNALFGLFLTFPPLIHKLPYINSHAVTYASLVAHFVQSTVLMLYWTAALQILLGDLKARRLEEVYDAHSRPAVLTCFATAASSMATVQILLRLFS